MSIRNWLRSTFLGDSKQVSANAQQAFKQEIPSKLGILNLPSLYELVEKLEAALETTYMENVKQRVLSKKEFSEEQYAWTLLELKRFFVMSSLMKNVPIYSDDVDLIWHEMLMFTREYEKFCQSFSGRFIHHQPNVSYSNETMNSTVGEDRAFYDIVYVNLFDISLANEVLLRPFGRYKLNSEAMNTIVQHSDEFTINKYFYTNAESTFTSVQHEIINRIRERCRELKAAQPRIRTKPKPSRALHSSDDVMSSMIVLWMFSSSESHKPSDHVGDAGVQHDDGQSHGSGASDSPTTNTSSCGGSSCSSSGCGST